MRLTAALALAVFLAALALLWSAGVFAQVTFWAAQQQAAIQNALGERIVALRGGQSAALWALIGLCAGYGFVHAMGPGHGKILVGGAAIGTRATALRMSAIALAGSLAQAGAAIAIVYGGFLLFETTARTTLDAADRWIDPLGNVAVALIGAWLILRGLRAFARAPRAHVPDAHAHGHDHDHRHDCGHNHGPTPEEAARATSLGATLALIAGMAARPCTGALFVLVIAWRMDLPAAGVAAVAAMGLGTAAFTILVAILAVASREAAFFSAGSGQAARLLGAGLQIGAGGLILGVSGLLVLNGLA